MPVTQPPKSWNEKEYLNSNDDVYDAVEAGIFESGWEHYVKHGEKENRPSFHIKEYTSNYLKKVNRIKGQLKNFSINYVIAAWSGKRREGNDKYHKDRAYYLRQHLRSLRKLKHSNISQITIVIANNTREPKRFTRYVESLPDKIGSTKLIVHRRENKGQSYGSYSYAYDIYRHRFSHYIFIEDDYLFVKDNFDLEMAAHLRARKNCGFLCSLVLPTPSHDYPHAAISNGIATSRALKKIWKKFGSLPHDKNDRNDRNPYTTWPQLLFSWAFIDIGMNLEDLSNVCRIPFNHIGILRYYGDKELDDLIIPAQFIDKL